MEITLADVLARIGLNSPPGPVYNMMLYTLLVLNLIAFFMQTDRQLITTLLLGLTLILIAIAKLNLIPPTNLLLLVLTMGIPLIPFIVAAMTRAKNSRPIALLAGLLGVVYVGVYWLNH